MVLQKFYNQEEEDFVDDKRSLSHLYDKVIGNLDGEIHPKTIFAFDVETHTDKNLFVFGSIVGDNNYRFTSADKKEFKEKLCCSTFNSSIIFSTNLQFDFFSVFDMRDLKPKKFKLIFSGSNLIYVKMKTEHGVTVFLDTLNFYKGSVENLGKIINIPKLKTPKFIGRYPADYAEWQELIAYNVNDSMITYKFSVFMQENFNSLGANMKATIASTAMDLYRREFLFKPYVKPKDEFMPLFHDAYYGGRTEIFNRGRIDDYFYYDVNSMYPYVMTFDYPDSWTMRYKETGTMENITEFHGISEVEVTAPKDYYPLLPHRLKSGKVVFPYGTFSGTYTHIELRKFMKIGGRINKISQQVYYLRTVKPFSEYVNVLYKKKSESKDIAIIYKILLNSLYGKFFQRPYEDMEFYHAENFEESVYKDYKVQWTEQDFFIATKTNNIYPRFVCPIWSLYTTAYARLVLYVLMVKNKAVYVDTDSLITKTKIAESKKLGGLKLEHNIKFGYLIKPKLYFLHDKDNKEKVKAKGLRVNSKSQFYELLRTRTSTYKKFFKTKESLKTRKHFSVNEIIEITKEVSLEDDKRKWENEFNIEKLQDSEPLYINEKT
jgi:hypothetical protein